MGICKVGIEGEFSQSVIIFCGDNETQSSMLKGICASAESVAVVRQSFQPLEARHRNIHQVIYSSNKLVVEIALLIPSMWIYSELN